MRAELRRAAGGLALGGLLLAGCGGMPTSGPVVAGEDIAAQSGLPPISIVAEPPRAGSDEVGIVEGFVLATGSYAPGFAVAREFLAPGVAAQWDPGSQIQVFDADRGYALALTAPGQVTVTLPLVGTVSPEGTYEVAAPGTVVEQPVALEQVEGEWRISGPPTGLLVSAYDFDREYSSFDVWFPEPSGDVLVPDQVVLPLRGSRATLLVQALLDGPSSWLAPAVRTAFPDGTALAVRAVEVDDGVARVSLSDQARQVEGLERSRMAAQLGVTLRQVPGLEAVRIEVGGSELVVAGADDGVVALSSVGSFEPAAPSSGSTVYAVRDGAVVSVLDDRTEPVGGPLGKPDVRAQSVAVALDSSRAAVIDESGRNLSVAGFTASDLLTLAATGTSLSTPTWDRSGLLWVADRTATGSRLLVSDGARVDQVEGIGLEGVRVETVRMAPDGVRLLMVVSSGGRTRVQVGLVRGPDEGPRTLGVQLLSLRELELPLGTVLDAAWSGTQQISLLGGEPDTELEPYQVDLSGADLAGQGSLAGATALAAAARNPVVLGTADGRLLAQDGLGGWGAVGEGRRPTYPG